ncbi:MAG TPA: hypothetical protein VFJ16_17720 [Longimicrobium sp.]|nr:hypothetical protein [Longimicrobium sp.]
MADEPGSFLVVARERGDRVLKSALIPPGLDHFTIYAGLISSALELAKLIQTEKRDLAAIQAHHDVEVERIRLAFREVEAAMLVDFQRDIALRERTFEAINLLIEVGEYDIALRFYERMVDGFTRGALETIIAHRNHIASASTARLEFR